MKLFTIDEAERALPKIAKLLKKAQRLREKIGWLLETHDAIVEVNNEDGFHYFVSEHVEVNKEFHKLYFQFYAAIAELSELGVILKDIDAGLIDFPFKSERESFLCWQLGEQRIRYWHDAESGFDGRQPIVDIDEFVKSRAKNL